jgi:anaerobic magnesium-protoporphyrin IX monomethyl ester cyclase
MIDVLLIQPPVRDYYLTAKRTIPYGLMSLASSLEAEGFSVSMLDALAVARSQVIDPPSEMRQLASLYRGPDQSPFALFHQFRHYGYSFQHIGQLVRSSEAFLVGISALFTPYIEEALKTATVVRQSLPNAWIVLGGHHPTLLPESVMANPVVDFVIRGEGEQSLPLLTRILKEQGSLETVPGLVFRRKDGSLQIHPPAVISDLDDLPPPAYHLLHPNYYRRSGYGSAVILGSRGCRLDCSYCSLGKRSVFPYRRRSVTAVLDEIDRLVRTYDVRFIDFEDENLTLNRRWAMALLEGIDRRFSGWNLEFRAMNGLLPSTLDHQMLTMMKRVGFHTLNLSLGTTVSAQLQRFRRPDVSRSFDRVLTDARQLGMDTVAYIIVGAPDQSATDSLVDLLYLIARQVVVGVSVYYPAPGSDDYKKCEIGQMLPAHFSLMRSTALPIDQRTTRLESATLLRLARIQNFMLQLARMNIDPAWNNRVRHGRSGELRLRQGLSLWRRFMSDGVIRGIDPEGRVFDHAGSMTLTRSYVDALERTQIGLIRQVDVFQADTKGGWPAVH